MPKTIKNIYDNSVSFENLLKAHKKARCGKREHNIEDIKKLYEISKKHYGFNDDWYLFGDTEPITNGKLRCRKNKNCKLAEVKQIRIHDFRHSCASLLINSGATINVVAKYLGHTKIDETLNTYSHLFKNQMNEIVSIIDKLN